MVTEVTAILLVTLVAAGLAVLGVLDLVWPAHRSTRPRSSASSARPIATASEPDTSVLATAPAIAEPAAETPPPRATLAETCQGLYEAGRFDELLEAAVPALLDATPGTSSDASMLWSLVGRARWALHDADGARPALRSAVDVAVDEDREDYRRQLSSIATAAAHDLLGRTTEAVDHEERRALLRSAREWLLAAGLERDSDGESGTLAAEIDAAYWRGEETGIRSALDAGNVREGRRLCAEALRDEGMTPEQRDTFVDLAAEALGAEVGELAASAVQSMQQGREVDALRALQRADNLSTSSGTLPADRREEINRRLWWAYTRFGVARVDAEEFEQALEPLSRALELAGDDPDRRDETGSAMVRALDGLVSVRAAMIREVVESGHGEAAIGQAERLWSLLESAIAGGVPRESLAAPLAACRELLEERRRGSS